MTYRPFRAIRVAVPIVLTLCAAAPALAQQLDEHCTVSVLNRNVRVNPDGSWVLPNIPANFGAVRARVTCVIDGRTVSGESEPFVVPPNRAVNVPRITFGHSTPIPTSLTIAAPLPTLTQIGAAEQLTVTAHYSDGTSANVSAASTGTRYTVTNAAIATVTAGGLVQAVKTGTVVIQATHEGASGMAAIRVLPPGVDTDGDGIPDEYELAHGFDPNNAIDALEDPDHDGLSNLQEFQRATDPRNADTDGDRLNDGQEVARGTDPLLWDTDGDGVADGLEVETGSSPLDPGSLNLAQALNAIRVTPSHFGLTFNTIVGEASVQLSVGGDLRDGRSIELTSTARGTDYLSNSLAVCSFGATDGRVFAGESGACSITVSNSGHTATATGDISTFSPTRLGFVDIPGYANNVDANGSFAYVAAGSAGLVVVDASVPSSPHVVASLDTPGNANDVRVVGGLAYVADGPAGLQIIDVSNPDQPRLRGTVNTPGEANDVIVSGSLALVADGPAGLQIIDVSDPAAPVIVKSVAMGGIARGVDVSGSIAVVVTDNPQPSLQVIDIANPITAFIVGGVPIEGEPIDVSLGRGFAYVAAYTGGVSIIDVRQPTTPIRVGGLPGTAFQNPAEGFVPRDVQTAGPFAIFAEQLFANAGAPIVDVSTPSAPRFRTFLDFGPNQDYAGTGIAVSGPYIYWTGQAFFVGNENGTDGSTRLFIGQYLAQEDRNGIAPTVSITAPDNGTTVIEGSSVTIRAAATDDVAVAQVTFTVNGEVAFVDTSEPYEHTFTVPAGIGTFVLSATAIDLGNNTATAPTVTILAVPDPLTTVVGRVLDTLGQPIAGATANARGRTAVTRADGSFTIDNVPTLQTVIVTVAIARDGTTLTGNSRAAVPVRGGTTDVGDIIAKSTSFENDLGVQVERCGFCDVDATLPFAFPLNGTAHDRIHINSGYVWFDNGDTLEAFCCALGRGEEGGGEPSLLSTQNDATNGGLYVNDQIPGRFVVTWFEQDTEAGGPNTVQIILFDDGRIQYGYNGVVPTSSAEVGVFFNDSASREVDFSAGPLEVERRVSFFEDFFSPEHPFDLDGGFVLLNPADGGGYSIRPVPDVTPPACVVVNPPDDATLFEGEPIDIEATATDNGSIAHVTFQMPDGGPSEDVSEAPFFASFIVPVGATRLTFNVTAYDSWNNAASCSSTVSVVPGPPPAIAVFEPAAGATVTAGATIPILIDDSNNRVPVAEVDLKVNGVVIAHDATPPFEFLFTVPGGVSQFVIGATATDTVGKSGVTADATVLVTADPLTTIQGRTIRSQSPIAGAQVTPDLRGATIEVFNADAPLSALPDLTGRTPDRIFVTSAINLRNPTLLFGQDAYGFGPGSHATRVTAKLETIGGTEYTFRLGVNAGGQLRVNGTLVVDLPSATGRFQEGTGTIDVPGGGPVDIEIRTFDAGNPEVQLSYSIFDSELEVPATDELTPTLVPYHATSATDGTFSLPNIPTTLGDLAVHATAEVNGRTARGRSKTVAPVTGGITDVGDVHLGGGQRVALLHADSNSFSLEQALVGSGLIDASDLTSIDVRFSTPTLETLSEFGAVVVFSNFPFGDPNGLGNVLADYVDQGGGVVIATYAFSSIWRLTCRITSPGYSPFNHFNNPTDTSGMIDFANSNTAHPIMDGVTQTQSYFENSNYTNPELTEGATLVAVDTAGNRVVAVNENERIVGISIFPGTFLPQGIDRLFANAVNFVR